MKPIDGRRSPAESLFLRPADHGDLGAVVEIERASFSDPWSESSFRSLVRAAHVYFVVGIAAEGDVTGYVIASFVADEGEIANLAVAPEARGRGVGALLLDVALREAERRGVRRVFLEVRQSNWPARSLYRSRGFTEIGRRRNYYRRPTEDALVLRRELGHG